ncbi:MAG: class I SAM-dependent methyltransferase [Anaerolineales bacterium]
MLWIIPVLLIIGLLLFWELYISEGAHLGRRFVRWLYRISATRYNQIKGYDRDWEVRYLGEPVAQVIGTLTNPRILDVGAGTGRLAWALEESGHYKGDVFCLEPSRAMIAQALPTEGQVGRRWLQAWARQLPFADGTFDMVTSLEILEFTPQPGQALQEMVRVLRPGGWLLVTNRIGWQAPLILGRTVGSEEFPHWLERHGLAEVEVFHWQIDYDLAWARKPHTSGTQEEKIEAATISSG